MFRTVLTAGSGTAHGAVIPTGLAAGTRVLTLDGAKPVEYLAPGDRIVTRDGGVRVLAGLHTRLHTAIRPVCIGAGTLAHAHPARDLVLAATQPVLLRRWRSRLLYGCEQVLVTASDLIDGRHVRATRTRIPLRLFTPTFGAPAVIYAEGAELAMPAQSALGRSGL